MLYKFTSAKTAKLILKSRSLKFSAAEDFNDPCEGLFCPSLVGDVPDHWTGDDDEKFQLMLAFWKQEIGIFCLTERPFNMTMWSHYAEGHSGACLQFAMPLFGDDIADVGKVKYRPDVLRFDMAEMPNHPEIFWTKGAEWEYEQEWRYIKFPSGPFKSTAGLDPIEPSKLKRVILGANTTDQDAEEIRALADQWPSDVPVVHALVHRTQYLIHVPGMS